MSYIIRVSALQSLLSQLVTPEASPHTAELIDHSAGSVIAHHSVPSQHPWPTNSLSDRPDEQRAKLYAAVVVSAWNENQLESQVHLNGAGQGTSSKRRRQHHHKDNSVADSPDVKPLLLETEVDFFLVP
ncbi:hypothetical protein T439DRAFT_126350 [Meredithblackwellia eburnea MCA 4105]